MKYLSCALSILALGLASLTSVQAQGATKYDPIMEKRADLRMKYVQAQHKAAEAAGAAKENQAVALALRKHETRIDHSYMVDFMARSAKRADLRMRISQVGMEKAYEEWMQREHGH